ncbi:hypothetical protein [Vibrio chagasii]|uniref:hypothetical protein n=1 Tax=Vibrio chagasii TaxID=170679 RepID=UPI003DA1A2BB
MRYVDALDPDMQEAVQCACCQEYWSEGQLPGEDEDICPDCGSADIVEVEKEDERPD